MQIFDSQAYNDSQSNSGYDRQLCRFSYEAIKQEDGSYDNIEYIRIRVDDKNEVFCPVQEEHKINYAVRYQAFVAGEEAPPEGTPLKAWAVPTPADLASCKEAKIVTVEQLANATDLTLQRGGLLGLKYKAIDWLEHNENAGVLSQLRDQLEKAKEQIKILQRTNVSLTRTKNEPTVDN